MIYKQARKPQTSKLRYFESTTHPPTDSLTGVKCRVTSVAKKRPKKKGDSKKGNKLYLPDSAKISAPTQVLTSL